MGQGAVVSPQELECSSHQLARCDEALVLDCTPTCSQGCTIPHHESRGLVPSSLQTSQLSDELELSLLRKAIDLVLTIVE